MAALKKLTRVHTFVRSFGCARNRPACSRVMIQKKIGFPDDEWAAIELEARRQGVPVSQIVRTGTLSYVAFSVARRGDEITLAFDDLWKAAVALTSVYPL